MPLKHRRSAKKKPEEVKMEAVKLVMSLDLDYDSVQALIRALANFQGGVFVVSHDEHLISATCDELWIIQDRHVVQSTGDFFGQWNNWFTGAKMCVQRDGLKTTLWK